MTCLTPRTTASEEIRVRSQYTMILVKIASGGHIKIWDRREEFEPGEANFLPEEYSWAKKLASGYRDPEELRDFWSGVVESKRADISWNVLEQFQKDPSKEVEREIPRTVSQRFAEETMEMFRGKRPFPKRDP